MAEPEEDLTSAQRARKLLDSILDNPLTDEQALRLAKAYIKLARVEQECPSPASPQPPDRPTATGASMGTG